MEWGQFYWKEDQTGKELIWNLKKLHAFTGIGTLDPKTACGLKPDIGAVRVERQRTVSVNPIKYFDVTLFGFLKEDNFVGSANDDQSCLKCMRKLAYPYVHLSDKIKSERDPNWTKLEESIAKEKEEEASKEALPPLDPDTEMSVRYEQEKSHGITSLFYFEWLVAQGFEMEVIS